MMLQQKFFTLSTQLPATALAFALLALRSSFDDLDRDPSLLYFKVMQEAFIKTKKSLFFKLETSYKEGKSDLAVHPQYSEQYLEGFYIWKEVFEQRDEPPFYSFYSDPNHEAKCIEFFVVQYAKELEEGFITKEAFSEHQDNYGKIFDLVLVELFINMLNALKGYEAQGEEVSSESIAQIRQKALKIFASIIEGRQAIASSYNNFIPSSQYFVQAQNYLEEEELRN